MSDTSETSKRKASCGCGAFTLEVTGDPVQVYACSCLNCQRESGGAFTYSAVYPEAAVGPIEGERKTWRRTVDSGRWLETTFCPSCGVTLFAQMEAWPGVTGVSVGCFADPDFAQPETVYFGSRRHHWLEFPEGVEVLDTVTA